MVEKTYCEDAASAPAHKGIRNRQAGRASV